MNDQPIDSLGKKLDRVIAALERMAPAPGEPANFEAADCFVWNADLARLDPVTKVNRGRQWCLRRHRTLCNE